MDGWDADAVVAFTVAWQAGRDAPNMADTKLADAIIKALTGKYALDIEVKSADLGCDRSAALRPQSVGACNVR